MKQFLSIWCILSFSLQAVPQTVPFNLTPDWISTPNGHIATGLGLADINGDGWKDLVVANGNDILEQHLVVYYNDGDGAFPPDPDWESADSAYHGHLACGDIDQDGDIDVAVSVYIGPGGFSSPGRVKVYYNEGNTLEATPSFISNPYYTFSCALGDADGDGDLDLATTAGEPYNDILDKGKIFLNTGGIFQANADWESDILMGSLDVEFGDINRDGLMDIIFACENTDNYIYLGEAGGISTSPAWQSAEPQSFINSVDIGYREPDECLVVMTENSQLGGNGKVRRYLFSEPLPASSTADWYSNPFGYGSGVLLADVDLDSTLDLIYGGWWLPVKIALGNPDGFQINPAYTSVSTSVVEAIQMADLGKESMLAKTEAFIIDSSEAGSHVIILPGQLAENIVGISKNGVSLSPGDYCAVPGKNWISFSQQLQENDQVVVDYEYSPHPDMVITNWDNYKGNYIFYNTNSPVGMNETLASDFQIRIYPNPASDHIFLQFTGKAPVKTSLSISDITGRKISDIYYAGPARTTDIDISYLPKGIYIIKIGSESHVFLKK